MSSKPNQQRYYDFHFHCLEMVKPKMTDTWRERPICPAMQRMSQKCETISDCPTNSQNHEKEWIIVVLDYYIWRWFITQQKLIETSILCFHCVLYSFLREILIGYLLCHKHCSRLRNTALNQSDTNVLEHFQ